MADAQQLPENFSGAFDRVLACLCYHIVPDHRKALTEMRRACKPGARVAMSVWGQKKSSPMFTLFGEALAELRASGVLAPDTAPPLRSSFHLGYDDAALRNEVAAAGFVDVISWHVPCVWGQQSGAAFADTFTRCQPVVRAALEQLPAAEAGQVVALLADKANQVLAAGRPIACDVVVVAARADY